jgi:Ca-activated chloride channel family protein
MHMGAPWFIVLALAPVVLAISVALRRTCAAAWEPGEFEAIASAPHTWRERLRLTPALLRFASLAGLAAAAAMPFVQSTRNVPLAVPRTMVIVLDASGSMLAMDVEPDRFGAARRFANGLIASRPADRIGLLAFGGRTAWLCPVTIDRHALAEALWGARAGTTELDEGTALGAAIVSAVEQIEKAGRVERTGWTGGVPGSGRGSAGLGGGAGGGSGGGAIVVLTDGASNDPRLEPIDAAGLAARRGIRVHAIGFGRDGPARYPTEVGVLDVTLPVRDEVLRRVTAETGGRYWRVTDEGVLERVLAAIEDSEPPASVRRDEIVFVALQAPLLAFAIVVLIVEIGLAAGPLRVRRI